MTMKCRMRGGKRAVDDTCPASFSRAPRDAIRINMGGRELCILTDESSTLGTIDGRPVSRSPDKAVVARKLIEAAKRSADDQAAAAGRREGIA